VDKETGASLLHCREGQRESEKERGCVFDCSANVRVREMRQRENMCVCVCAFVRVCVGVYVFVCVSVCARLYAKCVGVRKSI